MFGCMRIALAQKSVVILIWMQSKHVSQSLEERWDSAI